MKVLVLAADDFEDLELFVPLYRLREAGHTVVVAGPRTGTLTGKHGYSVAVDCTFEQVRAEDFGALVIPGGRAPEAVRLNGAAIAAVRQMDGAGKPIAAICHGAQVLISARLVAGRDLTCYQGVRDDVIAAGGHYQDAELVVDGHLITSRSPEDLPAFCGELLRQLQVRR
jgi:protease I